MSFSSRRLRMLCFCIEKFDETNSDSYELTSTSGVRSGNKKMNADNELKKKEKGMGRYTERDEDKAGSMNIIRSVSLLKGFRKPKRQNDLKFDRTVRAAVLIQKWYRSYLARNEIRKRYTWTIFQSIEYQGEQDQTKVFDFYNALLEYIPERVNKDKLAKAKVSYKAEKDFLEEEGLMFGDGSVMDLQLTIPVTLEQFKHLIQIFRDKDYKLHPKQVADILVEGRKELMKLPNVNEASTSLSKQITVCGDIHGNFEDLVVIFHKNGLPSNDNPYVFNGDFVDRGTKSLEVLLILLMCLSVFPGVVYLNRGNHEDHLMNYRYGFITELKHKYKRNWEKLIHIIDSVYRWLPLATLIDKRIFIIHGGISDDTSLEFLNSIDRSKYASVLRPPVGENKADAVNRAEWKQIFDLLWNDPRNQKGCSPNTARGAGKFFGADVTEAFTKKYRLDYIIRSHECKPSGFDITHNNKVITIFSVSNYYTIGSNNGAYMRIKAPNLSYHFVQFSVGYKMADITLGQRMGLIEKSAIKELFGKIMQVQDRLNKEFQEADPKNTGLVSISDWCRIMEDCTKLHIPWRILRPKIANLDIASNKVVYATTFQDMNFDSKFKEITVTETLYRNKSSLEVIFRIIDKDNSGYITINEFDEICKILASCMPDPIPHNQLMDVCRSMDINKDGLVDLNEFLETFRLVDVQMDDSSKTSVSNKS